MRIGIDGNEANISQKVGVGLFAYQLLLQLYHQKTDNQYFIFLKSTPSKDLPPEKANWHYLVFGPQKLWTRFALPFKLYFGSPKLDLFFSPSHYTPLFCPVPKLAAIMDLGYLDTPEQFTKKDYYQLTQWTKESIKTCAHLIAISEFTKQEIITRFHYNPNKITVVYPSVTPPNKINKNLISKWNLQNTPYFLYLGTLKPSKNIPFLINTFSQYNGLEKLVIAGKKGWLYNSIFELVKSLKLENKIVFTDYITEPEKWALLKQAKALCIPSLYEGFGIPALEALLIGTPVIASFCGSLPEIVGSCGHLLDSNDTQSWLLALKQPQRVLASDIGKLNLKFGWPDNLIRLKTAFLKVI